MKFSFSVSNSKEIKSLCKAKTMFIDAYATNDVIILFLDTQDVFVYSSYKMGYCDASGVAVNFRIPRDGFLSLIDDGVVSVTFSEGIIYLKIDNGLNAHTMVFNHQSCNVVNMLNKIELIEKCEEYSQITLSDLSLISKLSKNSNLPIVVENGIASIKLDALMVFSRTKCMDLAVFPATLSQLLSVCNDVSKIYSVENFIVYSNGESGIAITKAMSIGGSDYEFVRKQKEVESVEVDFSSAASLIARIRKYDDVSFDLNSKTLSLRDSESEYETGISVEDTSKSSSSDESMDLESVMRGNYLKQFPVVSFPESVFRQIMYLSKAKKLNISFTSKLIRMKISDNTLLVCRR